jgi:transitional endoplasmic reticulum ATPase
MDGLEQRGQIIVIASTNMPNSIDPALRRPGRFDREIFISVPDEKARLEILKVHTRHMALGEDINLKKLAEMTHGFVGADLAGLCQEAGILAIQEVLPQVEQRGGMLSTRFLGRLQARMEHFEKALKTMRPSTLRSVAVEVPDVKWADVGGLVQVKERLQEAVIWPLKHAALFKEADVQPPRGILLTGPPGTGKTLLAKALANESSVNFISVKGPALISKYVGESEKAVREVFAQARQAAPCIIFFDEIDAIAPRRGQDPDSSFGDRIVAQLLTEMDGIEELKGVLVLAATNRPDAIDQALLRSGRFDEIIEIPNPDVDSRLEILKIHTRNKPMAKGVDLAKLAILTEGMNGAELEAACRQAAMRAVRRTVDAQSKQQCAITQHDLVQAINDVRAKSGKPPIAVGRPRVLVVDDEKDVLRLICKVLTHHGYEGVAFEHPNDAMERVQSEYFDVALLDIHLPDKDGVQLLRDIKVVQPHVGVIMVTAEADVHFAIESMKAGASDYLLKPFDMDTLVSSVQEAVQKARSSGSQSSATEASA